MLYSIYRNTALIAGLLGFSGCGMAPLTQQQLENRAYFENSDVGRRQTQKAIARHPDLAARMKSDGESGKRITTPRVLKTVPPIYPIGRQIAGAQSGVWISFVVAPDGSTESVEWELDENALTHPSFVESAKQAVRKWKFQPATVDGKPVPYMMIVPVVFELR